jgi:hypothetical protein
MRIIERYRRRDVGHLEVAITFDDPDFCNENEKDRAHMGK